MKTQQTDLFYCLYPEKLGEPVPDLPEKPSHCCQSG